MTPQKVLDEIASSAALGSFILGVQGAFQFAQLVGEQNPWSLVFGVTLVSSALGLWQVRRGIRARKSWARNAYEALLWGVVAVSVGVAIWLMLPAPRPINQDMADVQELSGRILPLVTIPWLGLLAYELWRVRRPDVRALLGEADAEAR